MDSEIESQFERARELLEELKKEHEDNLQNKIISSKSKNLTHEVLTKLRSTLDHAMTIFFEKDIAPTLSIQEKKQAKVYFPVVNSDHALASTLGRAKMSNLKQTNPPVYTYIKSIQPYVNDSYKWLEHLNTYAVEGKHLRLTPQKRIESKSLTISSNGASMSLGQGATVALGSGARISLGGKEIMGGQTIDVNSNRIYGDSDLEVKKEVWVSFLFEGTTINTLGLCEESLIKTKKIVEDFLKLV